MYQRLQCRDKYFFKIKFVFFLYLRLSASSKENDVPLCIYFWYQTDSGVPNTSIYSAVCLASPYYNYLWSTASTTMICWRFHSNSVNTGSRLPICSDVKTRKRRNVIGIDMIRNNRIESGSLITITLGYSRRHSVINHYDWCINLLIDNDDVYLLVCLIYLLLFWFNFWVIVHFYRTFHIGHDGLGHL